MAMAGEPDMMTEPPETEADVFTYLRERELSQIVYQSGNEKLLSSLRNVTIERMLIVAQKLSLGWSTRAAAVAYFDGALIELSSIPSSAFSLLAIASLLIAAKMEEEEINVPTVSNLLAAAESTSTMQELNVMELLILKVWKWNVCVVTPAHFIPFYARVARVYDTTTPEPREEVMEPEEGCVDIVIKDPVTRLALCVAEAAALDATALEYLPSVLAASSVAVARMQCGVSPHWPHTLSALAGFPTAEGAPPIILSCCSHLLGLCHFGEEAGGDRVSPAAPSPPPVAEEKVHLAAAASFGGPMAAEASHRPFKTLNAPSSFGAPPPKAASAWRQLRHGPPPSQAAPAPMEME
mmetsp:Transcript_20677/g.53736  ORF Transcript_20677/g.53736 Transcript_20677/m.53736 type:complete len:352 (-) Transcript_20677:147-1202(-)